MNKISTGCDTTVNQLPRLLDGYNVVILILPVLIVSYLIWLLQYMHIVTVT